MPFVSGRYILLKLLTMRLTRFLIVSSLTALSGCSLIRENSKYQLSDGRYFSRIMEPDTRRVYVDNEDDDIIVYPLKSLKNKYTVDTSGHRPQLFGQSETTGQSTKASFTQASFDIDILTIPFKYRFSTATFPRQITANINGAVYLGYRSDVYVLRYRTDPLGTSIRYINHFGFSVGGFTGLGSSAMNPWVTNNQIDKEYDGVVWPKGLAAIFGLNNFTAGLAVGWDHLLDPNRKYWIYQRKPWVGFVFGLNLN